MFLGNDCMGSKGLPDRKSPRLKGYDYSKTGSEIIVVGDFNADGNSDVVVSNKGGQTFSLFLGDGAGGFSLPTDTLTNNSPERMATCDFNLDGNLDLAVTSISNANVSVFFGDGAGGFGFVSQLPVFGTPGGVTTGDFNSDGIPDLVVANRSDQVLLIYPGE